MAEKIVIDTDIGEDIDDILACAFALRSPEFEVLAITTVDGDTQARSRIARRLTQVAGQPRIPVAAGFRLNMPQAEPARVGSGSVTQFDLAPVEDGLPPASELRADALIAKLAEAHPGQISVLTIGSMANVGQLFVRYPEAAAKLKQVVTNGGNFGPARETVIGWNLRYDPVAAAIVARGPAPWALLPEGAMGQVRWTLEDAARLRADERPLPRLLSHAIELWRKNKRECTPASLPHMSDLNVFAYLLGGWTGTFRGRAFITVPPRDRLAELRIEEHPEGPHRLGQAVGKERGEELRALFFGRIFSVRE